MPQIEVTFDIDANGILNVSAKDKKTGKENKIVIESSSGLNSEEIQRMQKDAESHAEEDKKKRELAEARNEADALTWSIEKSLKENSEKIPEKDKAPIQAAVEKVKQAASQDDPAAIKQAMEELKVAAQAMAQFLQGQPGAGPQAASPGGSEGDGKGKDDVIDAEFEVKN